MILKLTILDPWDRPDEAVYDESICFEKIVNCVGGGKCRPCISITCIILPYNTKGEV